MSFTVVRACWSFWGSEMAPDTAGVFCFETLFTRIAEDGHAEWAERLRQDCSHALRKERHGQLTTWLNLLQRFPRSSEEIWFIEDGHITEPSSLFPPEYSILRDMLMELRPWRKGPFDLMGIRINTEWRSDLKWDRIARLVEWRDRRVLDVGCGNGYFGWRMLDAGASTVVGLDPFLLYVVQHEVVRRCMGGSAPNYVLPLSDSCLPKRLSAFDVAVSMGVLYHCTSPIDHLLVLRESLVSAGRLILETLIVECDRQSVLLPEDRYAKMRNVWFIPSPDMLELWLQQTGFTDISLSDITRTTSEEQRRTEWMTFESLTDFLDPNDPNRTIEGHPAPVRAVVTARRKD